MVDAPSVPVCDQADCPIATEGRCLEGFQGGQGCPHLQSADAAEPQASPESGDAEPKQEPQSGVTEAEDEREELVSLGGNESLTTSEAHDIAAEYGAELVLLAGEFESGKTTLLVELYSKFLAGPIDGWLFAGSKTLIALDTLHFPTRYASGNSSPITKRTEPEQEGLIHLRMARNKRTVALLFTDLRGERFEDVRNGASPKDEIPYIRRANRTLVLVDGDKIKELTTRQSAIHNARQLIGGLSGPEGVGVGRPMAIVLTKRDVVDDDQRTWFEEQARALAEFAAERGAVPSVMTIAARPAHAPDEAEGLEGIVQWLTETSDESVPASAAPPMGSDRQFWRSLGVN